MNTIWNIVLWGAVLVAGVLGFYGLFEFNHNEGVLIHRIASWGIPIVLILFSGTLGYVLYRKW